MSVRNVSAVLAEKARIEVNEDPNRVKDGLQQMKEWIARQPHLRARTDDQWLIAFLRGCKFSIDKTKEKLDLYYSLRCTTPELYKFKHTDKTFVEIFNLGTMVFLPKLASPDAPAVALIRPGRYDASKYSVLDILSVVNILQKLLLMDDDNGTIVGNMTILDLQGVTFGHFIQMTPGTIKKMMIAAQDATPLRMKGFHLINAPPGAETIFNAMKSLLNEKNRNRLYVHDKNYVKLFQHVPKDILPAEYGGNGGTTEEILGYWRNKLIQYDSFLEEDYQYGTDETKRVVEPKTKVRNRYSACSFRKLDVD